MTPGVVVLLWVYDYDGAVWSDNELLGLAFRNAQTAVGGACGRIGVAHGVASGMYDTNCSSSW